MNKFDDCEFCSLKDGSEPTLPRDLQLLCTERLQQNLMYDGAEFYLKPDISPVVKGHLLIIPKKHYFSILSLPIKDLEELNLIKQKIIDFYAKENKLCLFFEHGCCGETDTGSSCIHHAHLHSIPISLDDGRNIMREAIRLLGMPNTNMAEVENSTYLFMEIAGSSSLYWKDLIMRSQFFRILISETFGEFQRSRWHNCIINLKVIILSDIWYKELIYVKL